ncbi:MAG: LuxR family transcriptional regulator, partial [Ekhidna sp.]|nr:LuxR family transcriptional regulator [Ekhidna sp.]
MSLYKVAGIKTFSGVIRIFCTSLLFLVSIARVFGQELPPIQSFAATTYNADNQNWSISQSQDKLIYVANNKGLLQYNGANWKLYETPDKTIMRSVKVVDEKIYTGSHQEFGFWVRDERDMLKYTSLSQNLKIPLLEDEEFWRIEKVDKWIVFQSLSRIYILDPEDLSVNVVESTKKITDLYPIGSQLYYHQQQKGIFEIKNGKSELTSSNTIFLEDDVINIFAKEDRLIVLTKSNGFYAVKDNKVSKITSSLDDDPYVQIYCSILLSDRSIAIGTIANGILILDESLTLKYKINQNKGLLNNTVLDLFEDYDKNLWVGLDNGINLIEMESPIRVFTDLTGSLGSVYTTIVFEDQLFIGTNQGLFRKDKISNEFELLGGTKGQVWYLTIIEESLYIGHHNGTFVFKKDQLRKIDGTQGTWNVKPISDEILIQGTYNGLYVLQKEDGDYTVRNKVEGFNYSARHLEIIDNTIIVNHEYKGLFVLTMDNNFEEILEQRNEIDLKDSNSGLARADNQILYACSKGVFKFDVDDKAFIRDSLMSTIYDQEDYISGKMIVHEARDETWFFSQDRISRVKSGGLSSSPKIEHFSISQKSRRSVIEYESIIPCDEKNYLIGTSFGY